MSKHFARSLQFLAALIMVTACSNFQSSPPSSEALSLEEEKIYALFFGEGPQTVVILQQTSTNFELDSPQSVAYIREGLAGLSDETFSNFIKRNQEPADLSPQMQIGAKYILVGNDELNEIMAQSNGWERFHEKFPNSGYTQFSHAGFNAEMDQAFVYVGRMAGPLMGYGSYYLLEKQAGRWVIKEELMAWIS